MRGITFLPFGFVLERPSVFALGAARRAATREGFEVLRLEPAEPFAELFFERRRSFAATASRVENHAPV
jgi:hypothetical protein